MEQKISIGELNHGPLRRSLLTEINHKDCDTGITIDKAVQIWKCILRHHITRRTDFATKKRTK